jgi:hypothetical protein
VVITCRTAVKLIPDFLSASTGASTAVAFQSHIDGCADCAAILRTYRKTIELTRSFLHRQDLASWSHGHLSCHDGRPDSFQRSRSSANGI